MTRTLQLGLVGYGKIARDQHLPAIAGTPDLELVAVASRNAKPEGVRNYRDVASMIESEPMLDAVILCQPPQVRFESARTAILAGKHVFLEKPPGATISEVEALIAMAADRKVTLFASWHSRYAASVATAREWIAGNEIAKIDIVWREDVRHWHPGQAWIWEPGGFGVFDPGINALSIVTEIVGEPIRVVAAELEIPANRDAPIAARLSMETGSGIPVTADFDWLQTGLQTWNIDVHAGPGHLRLANGGNDLLIDGEAQPDEPENEYPRMYSHFSKLVRQGRSDVDLSPLRLVADAFLCGRSTATAAFEDRE